MNMLRIARLVPWFDSCQPSWAQVGSLVHVSRLLALSRCLRERCMSLVSEFRRSASEGEDAVRVHHRTTAQIANMTGQGENEEDERLDCDMPNSAQHRAKSAAVSWPGLSHAQDIEGDPGEIHAGCAERYQSHDKQNRWIEKDFSALQERQSGITE